MVNLGPIDFQFCLPLNINGNDHEQNKFEVHIINKYMDLEHGSDRMAEGGSACVSPTLSLATIAKEGSTKDHLSNRGPLHLYRAGDKLP